jgi:acyl carrier protein
MDMPHSRPEPATIRLRGIVAAAIGATVDEVAADAAFYDDLMADSLQKLEIVVQIERAFTVRFSNEEAAALHSVDDALALLHAKGATTDA